MTAPTPDAGVPGDQQATRDTGRQGQQAQIDQLAARQDATDSKLDRILGILDTGGRPAPAAREDQADRGARPGQIQAEMQEAIRAVNAEQQAAAASAAHAAEHEKIRNPPAETRPREVGVRGKARLQALLFGGDPR